MTRTTRMGRTVEDPDWPNGLVPLWAGDFSPGWDHRPVGPFRVQAWFEDPGAHGAWSVHDHLRPAIEDFAGLLQRRGWAAVVLDEAFRVVIGWSLTKTAVEQWGAPIWYGCEQAFDVFESLGIHDPLSVLGWATIAKVGNG